MREVSVEIHRTIDRLLELTHLCMDTYLKHGEGAKVQLDAVEMMEVVHLARQIIQDCLTYIYTNDVRERRE